MIAFGIIAGLVFLLMLAVLELNKNTILGFVLLLLMTVCFVLLIVKLHKGGKWYWKVLSWIGWLCAFVGILFLTWPPTKAVPAYEGKTPIYTASITTDKGDVRGVYVADGAVELYAGIPYAKAPVGELRWKEPQPADAWKGVRTCDHFAPMCMQPTELPIYSSLKQIIGYHDYKISLSDNYVPPVSEDGLYVNVWKPAGEQAGLPVLVYIHGGSLQTGQPWYGDYAGTALAEKGAVVVNLGYRLGVFGFYADEELIAESEHGTTGNYGLLDQIRALEWVKRNIAAFGGDPDNVTIAGESAGSASVSALCTSPLAKGLFRRAVLESSTVASVEPPHSFRLFDEALESGKELKARYNAASVADLRALDAKTLVNEAYTQHHITVDGYALIETPYESYRNGRYNEEALLHGYNSEESAPFIIFSGANLKNYEQKVRGYFKEYADDILDIYRPASDDEAASMWARIYGAVFFDYPHYCLSRLANENGIPNYEYYFSKQNGRLSAWHSGELIYFYGNLSKPSKLFTEADYALSETMMDYLLNFMKTGDPNGEGLPAWTQAGEGKALMGFGDTVGMTDEQSTALFAVLDCMTGWQ